MNTKLRATNITKTKFEQLIRNQLKSIQKTNMKINIKKQEKMKK